MKVTASEAARGVGVLALLLFAGTACGPPHWRYPATLAPPAALPGLPDGNAIAIGESLQYSPPMVAAVGKLGSPGAVDLFAFDRGTWFFVQRLQPRPGVVGNFAVSVALSGDTLAIGANHDDPQKVNNGYLDIYVRGSDGWAHQQTVTVATFTPINTSSTEFGFARTVALDGDDLVVGAGRFAGGYGRVFVFHRTNGVFAQVAELKEAAADQRFDANFGDSVRIVGDTILDAGSYSMQVRRTELSPGAGHTFGTRVAMRGIQLLIGAPGQAMGPPAYSAPLAYIDDP